MEGAWLARLSDPAGLNDSFPCSPFPAEEPGRLQALVELAGRHNVRPSFVKNLRTQFAEAPQDLLSGDSGLQEKAETQIMEYATDLRLLDFARAALLADTARTITESTVSAGLPVVLVKGVDFAEAAYGGLHARTFSDIDLLARPDAVEELSKMLRDQGFAEVMQSAKHSLRTERQWTRADAYGGNTLVEVHTDMVHAPELRAAQTLTYDLYADPEAGGVTPAARLVLAGLHGATSHLFGRLQYVVDGLMIVRMGVDKDELAERAKRSNSKLAVATMLRLAAEIFGCCACRDLYRQLQPIPSAALERRLITAPMVVSAKDPHRWRFLPQRYLYRYLLRRAPVAP